MVVYVIAIGADGRWAVYERKPNGSLRRIVTPALPSRAIRAEAENDLAAWLRKRKPEAKG